MPHLNIESPLIIDKTIIGIKNEARNKEIASVILKILSDNKTTYTEALSLLDLAKSMITQTRLEIVRNPQLLEE